MELKMKMPFAEYFKNRSNLDINFLNRITALEVIDYNNIFNYLLQIIVCNL